MYSKPKVALKFLSYYFTAANGRGHGMHSPFVFDFITKVINDKTNYPAYAVVEKLRGEFILNDEIITVEDFGAGSSNAKTNQRSIASIAKNASKPAKFGQLLYRMAHYYRPPTILELGTSLGITSSYLALANPAARVVTMEGAGSVAAIATQNFQSMNLQNISVRQGNFDETLTGVLDELPAIDFCFIDGNHRKVPTEHYFSQILPRTHNDTILVFDDIHWSAEMEQAWENIRHHPAVRCSIDLFFIGIVLFRHEFKEKQQFSVRF